ncbi:DUF58 domain-containing protein [uncultured Cohaesibacter sp.]|uniref:DUF58 domain-containing protein n=1 Tax=uncultured Cohaesibacter sp. TaxID=1002546 RepID=UPI002931A866|nr:DUF58 domain-containing protein [uncultured Cohaesibacter sp.]
MRDLHPNPVDSDALEEIRLRLRKRFMTSGAGAILRRKMGQSLDYRDHRSYNLGDDVRHVDWRASARHGGERDFLVRSFEAEEQFLMLVVVDASATMRAGLEDEGRVSKLEVALWLVETLSVIAMRENIAIAFAALDGRSGMGRPVFVQGGQIEAQGLEFKTRLLSLKAPEPGCEVDIAPVLHGLKQSSVTVLISDFYRTGTDKSALQEAIQLASRGFRQVVVCELDSWPAERAILAREIVSLAAVGGIAARKGEFQASGRELRQADAAILQQRQSFMEVLHLGGVIHFPWDLPQEGDVRAVADDYRVKLNDFLLRSELFGRSV